MKKKILLVDNDFDCLEIFECLLDAEGYEVKAVPALALAPAAEFDLIILDENLEGQQGSDYCNHLKSNPQTANIPVVITSALDKLESIADSCRADHVLRKPFEIVEFEELVRKILN